MSWNCQGVKANGTWLTNALTGINIVALQENWLFGHEERFLNLSDKHFVLNHSSMPNDRSLLGRPYGGLAFLIDNNLVNNVKNYETNESRIEGITLCEANATVLILNVYFPVNAPQNQQQISTYLGKLHALTMQHDGPVIILGDFNISPKHSNFS